MLGITASPQEYDDYVDLLIKNPRLGHTYKAYFGDIYQLDGRLLPQFDYVSLFHLGEYRTPENDSYGALTDLEMTLMLADKVKPGGEILFYSGSFAYDKAEAVGKELVSAAALRAGAATTRACASSGSGRADAEASRSRRHGLPRIPPNPFDGEG